MFEYRISDTGALDLLEVERTYLSYFARIGDLDKGERWAARFFQEYRTAIERLKENPFVFSKCDLYPFSSSDTEYRSFSVGWFTVFYTVEEESFTVWHVRSSRSDFRFVTRR